MQRITQLKDAQLDNTIQKWVKKVKDFLLGLCLAIILTGLSYLILSPIIGVVSGALMEVQDVLNPLVFIIPQNFTMDNFRLAWIHMDYVNTLILTMSFSIGMAALHVIITSMVGYGFARFKFPGSKILFGLMIITIVIPVQTFMVPLFLQLRFFNFFGQEINLIGSYMSLALLTVAGVGLRSGLYIYIFCQFFRGLPKEIEEAALIDGASSFRTFAVVMIPNATPVIITVFLFAFVWHYNDTFYTSLLIPGNRLMPVMLTALWGNLTIFQNIRDTNIIQLAMYAGVVLAIAPVLIIYLFLQRHFIEGIERSGIVG